MCLTLLVQDFKLPRTDNMVRRKSIARSFSGRSESSSRTSSSEKIERVENIRRQHKRKPRRRTHVLQEIKYLQKTTHLLIPKAPFARIVRELILEIFPRLDINRIQASALAALQEATEMYMTQFFEDSQLLTFHAKRVTLYPADMRLIRRLRGRDDVINR